MLFGHQSDDNKPADSAANAPVVSNDGGAAIPTAPASDVSLPLIPDELTNDTDATAPVLDQTVAPASVATSEPSVSPSDDVLQTTPADDLLNLKQQALQQLGPLVGHLEQSPEEKFRTTMMMIQSSDNQALIKDAYAAAQAITDDKVRAQALLDIVNEINYFTQQAQAN